MTTLSFKRETVETIMGVVYFSDDGWATVWKQSVSGMGQRGARRIYGKDADLARFLAMAQSTSEAGRS